MCMFSAGHPWPDRGLLKRAFQRPANWSLRAIRVLPIALSAASFAVAATAADEPSEPYDLWIKGGLIHDGGGGAPVAGDVLVRGDQIVRVGPTAGVEARRVIDAAGRIVAPGFIDTHSHGDPLTDKSFENFALQGVTSVVLGQDGGTPGYSSEDGDSENAPSSGRRSLAEWMTAVEKARLQTNIATLVGHGTLRLQAGVGVSAEPTDAQMEAMQTILREGLAAGAFGMSSGLEYVPGRYAQRSELVALADTVGRGDGVIMSHMRSEDSDKVVEALDELLAQSRASRVHVSHLKIVFAASAREGDRVLALLDAARKRGVIVTADAYPYLAGYGDLSLVYPPWAKTREEWNKAVATDRPRLEAYLRERIALRGGAEAILLAEPPYTNQTLAQVAAQLQRPVEAVVIDVMGFGGPSAAHFNMREDVQDGFIAWEHASICTDGGPSLHHPRSWGTYPKVLQEIVRERKVITMEHAIRKMSGLPATIVPLAKRGRIKAGYYADLVIFSPETVRSTATWEKPAQAPIGIDHVIVNGCVQVENSRMTSNDCGRLLRKSAGANISSTLRK
ncbi:MAG: N-acyl-D-amino-acid deacylase family protein [Steroidobacter sp.]